MDLPLGVIELENRSVGPHGEPTLARACKLLLQSWDAGDRGRELALHLMYLCWYLMLEPAHLTGMETSDALAERLQVVFNEVHEYFSSRMVNDPEMLYVVGLMASISPWLLGNDDTWRSRSEEYRRRYRELAPQGIRPGVFKDRGSYGDYFAGQARVKNGY